MAENRISKSYDVRMQAAELAKSRSHPSHESNGDEQKYAGANYALSFTKGLQHDKSTGLIKDSQHFQAFRQAIDDGFIDPFNNRVPVPNTPTANTKQKLSRRFWEAPTAGTAYDLEGPDCQAVTMAPAPALCSDELAFEMAEVYELALLRDTPFSHWDSSGAANAQFSDSINRMNSYAYAQNGFSVRPRLTDQTGQLDAQTAFRGSSPGADKGPYLSQFMLIGNSDEAFGGNHTVKDGLIQYGALQISQKIPEAKPVDYMTNWNQWLTVQEGFDVNKAAGDAGQEFTGNRRFIYTPRDLATYVHYDALYEAYLNACLILLSMGTPFDPGFASLSGMRKSFPQSSWVKGALDPNAGGFALYGGPHILTLVTEVATRALKAARYQKFNVHIRARPEVLAARLHKESQLNKAYGNQFCDCITNMSKDIKPTIDQIESQNSGAKNRLLPMAFREGSPMHPAYAAGHATVAGACVTILKAYFDTGTVFVKKSKNDENPSFRHANKSDIGVAYVSKHNGKKLVDEGSDCPLTLEGELNKLAANISIGRNMAGVHYFSDYYDSLRMGEEIAIGLLEEQAICYPTDPFVMSLPTFDGKTIRIGAR